MTKPLLFLVILGLIVSFSYFIYINAKQTPSYVPGRWPEADTAINQAQYLFKVTQQSGVDFSTGPCLSNALLPVWVADVVHSPRIPLDDLPENQCTAYTDGVAKHYVELDTGGSLIRVK